MADDAAGYLPRADCSSYSCCGCRGRGRYTVVARCGWSPAGDICAACIRTGDGVRIIKLGTCYYLCSSSMLERSCLENSFVMGEAVNGSYIPLLPQLLSLTNVLLGGGLRPMMESRNSFWMSKAFPVSAVCSYLTVKLMTLRPIWIACVLSTCSSTGWSERTSVPNLLVLSSR